MKIAICFSGGLRTFPLCYENIISHFSNIGEVDCFISTWEKPCYTKVQRFHDVYAIEGDCIQSNLLHKDAIITPEYLMGLYPFKGIEIDTMDDMGDLLYKASQMSWHIMHPARLLCQYYKVEKCNNLRKRYEQNNNIQYDLIVKIRCDITLDNIPSDIDCSKIYINNHVYTTELALIGDTINEMIAISNPVNMDKICNIYNNFNSLWSPQEGFGEMISYRNLQVENIVESCELFPFGITVNRGDGNIETM